MGLRDCTQPLGPKAPAVLSFLLQPSPPLILGTRQGKGFMLQVFGAGSISNPSQAGPASQPTCEPRPATNTPSGTQTLPPPARGEPWGAAGGGGGGDTSLASAWRGTGGGARPESQGEEEWVASAYPRHAPPNPLRGGEPRPAPRKPGATYQPARDNAVLGTSAMVAALGWRGRRGAEWGARAGLLLDTQRNLPKKKKRTKKSSSGLRHWACSEPPGCSRVRAAGWVVPFAAFCKRPAEARPGPARSAALGPAWGGGGALGLGWEFLGRADGGGGCERGRRSSVCVRPPTGPELGLGGVHFATWLRTPRN